MNSVLPVALAITKEERQLWNDDPIQFVNQGLRRRPRAWLITQVYYDYTNVRVEAGDFLRHLAKVRANDILMPFLQFMTSQVRLVASSLSREL